MKLDKHYAEIVTDQYMDTLRCNDGYFSTVISSSVQESFLLFGATCATFSEAGVEFQYNKAQQSIYLPNNRARIYFKTITTVEDRFKFSGIEITNLYVVSYNEISDLNLSFLRSRMRCQNNIPKMVMR